MNNLRFHHHVYLVSGEAAPNITPALDRTLRPGEITLVVSPDMTQRAQWLSRVLKQAAGVTVKKKTKQPLIFTPSFRKL